MQTETMAVTLTVEQLSDLVREAVAAELDRRDSAERLDSTLTIAETAQLLQCSEASIRRWIDREGLPALRLGDCWRFMRSDVLDWARGRAK